MGLIKVEPENLYLRVVKSSNYLREKPKKENFKHAFYENMKPLFILDFLFSTLPLTKPKNMPYPVFRLFSWSMLYTLVTYLCWTTMIIVQIVNRSENVHWNFDGRMAFYRGILLLSYTPVIPILHWTVAPRMVDYFKHWEEFEMKYIQVTGCKSLKLGIRKLTTTLSLIISLSPLVLTAFHTLKLRGFSLWFAPIYWKATCTGFLLNGLWHSMFKALNVSAVQFNKHFKSALENKTVCQGSKYHVIQEYRHLWLQLVNLVKETGSVTYRAYMLHWLLLCGILTLSSYGLLVSITNPGGSANLSVNYMIEGMICFVQCYIITEIPHHTAKLVKCEVQTELENLLKSNILSGKARDEVSMFLQTIAMNRPVVNLGDFFTVDRSLLTSLLSTLMTYLIVLIQFRMGTSNSKSFSEQNTTYIPYNYTETSLENTTDYF